MTVTLLLFASYRERVGQKTLTLELNNATTIAETARKLEADFAGLSLKGALAAINEHYASPDTVLKDGDTLALFPPVSGGSGEDQFIVTQDPLELERYAAFASAPAWGALATFLGSVRSPNAGSEVAYIDYQGYEAMMRTQMRLASQEARASFNLGRVVIAHRLGRLAPGEASIAVVVSSAHRRDALLACSALIDRLKEILPVWKYEVSKDKAAWVAGVDSASKPI